MTSYVKNGRSFPASQNHQLWWKVTLQFFSHVSWVMVFSFYKILLHVHMVQNLFLFKRKCNIYFTKSNGIDGMFIKYPPSNAPNVRRKKMFIRCGNDVICCETNQMPVNLVLFDGRKISRWSFSWNTSGHHYIRFVCRCSLTPMCLFSHSSFDKVNCVS